MKDASLVRMLPTVRLAVPTGKNRIVLQLEGLGWLSQA